MIFGEFPLPSAGRLYVYHLETSSLIWAFRWGVAVSNLGSYMPFGIAWVPMDVAYIRENFDVDLQQI